MHRDDQHTPDPDPPVQGGGPPIDHLLPLIYQQAREIADQVLSRDRAQKWVQASSLVQQAMIRLVDQRRLDLHDSAKVSAALATTMRRIVIDVARRETADKRGGERPRVSLQSWTGPEPDTGPSRIDALEVNDALESLAARDAIAARVVEMRLWGGMDLVATSLAIGETLPRTRAIWNRGKAHLTLLLRGGENHA